MGSVMKSLKEARSNFEGAIATIPSRYTSGIEKATWADAASSDAAEANYATQVQKAIASKARAEACRAAGDVSWKTGAKEKGAPIIGERVRRALPKYESNFGPIYDSIQRLVPTLPAKTVDFRTNIETRLVKVVEEWKKASGKD